MSSSYPNQKMVVIHRDRRESDFLQISNENWMEFNKKYGPYALQVYLYLSKNANNYKLALSQEAAKSEVGIAKTTFHKYVDLLIDEGFLVWRSGNTYDFYETPHKQEEKEMESSPCGKSLSSQQEQENLSHERRSSQHKTESPQANKEIHNIYKDNKHITKDIQQQQEEKGETTRIAEERFVF